MPSADHNLGPDQCSCRCNGVAAVMMFSLCPVNEIKFLAFLSFYRANSAGRSARLSELVTVSILLPSLTGILGEPGY